MAGGKVEGQNGDMHIHDCVGENVEFLLLCTLRTCMHTHLSKKRTYRSMHCSTAVLVWVSCTIRRGVVTARVVSTPSPRARFPSPHFVLGYCFLHLDITLLSHTNHESIKSVM